MMPRGPSPGLAARYHVRVRLLVISDIHGNLAALEAVLDDAQARKYRETAFLGDALGYGPRPREVLALLRELDPICVLGNHDAWALEIARGGDPVGDGVVGQALRWQLGQLAPGDLKWVGEWPDGFDDDQIGGRYRHGSPSALNTYVDSLQDAREAFAQWGGRLCFVGHTHLPSAYASLIAPTGAWIKHHALSDGGPYQVPPPARVILNPGSVGQPRDGDPRASYAIYDSRTGVFEVFRVRYDIARTQAEIREAGLPEVLASRLEIGN